MLLEGILTYNVARDSFLQEKGNIEKRTLSEVSFDEPPGEI